MSPTPLPRSRIVLMVVIDAIALSLGLALFLWLQPKDINAAAIAFVACATFGAFFNLVIFLVTRKP